MVNFKKNALAVALIAGLGFAANAGAYVLTTGGDATPVKVATADIAGAATVIGVNENFEITLDSSDLVLGRTTGFTVRVNLDNGAVFGAALTNADLSTGAGAPGWTPSIAAGGAAGDNFVVIKLDEPNPAPTGLTTGLMLSIAGADAVVAPTTGSQLRGLVALQTAGAQVKATTQFIDPVTATQILAPKSLAILESGNPVSLACDAQNGDTAKKIDVGSDANHGSKTFFSSTGAIGVLDENFINLGTVDVSADPAFGTFAYAGTDAFVTTVSGSALAAFAPVNATRGLFLSSAPDCSADVGLVPVFSAANNSMTFTYTGADVAIAPTGFSAFVCAHVPNNNAVVLTTGSISVTTKFTRGATVANGAACDLLPLRYNGSVVKVATFNPGGNSTAQSFVRITNPSAQGGNVTIDAIDDAGDAGGAVTFTLAAGQSVQLNSDDLENGNAAKGLTGSFGDGAGKWRLVVTGEFADMVVSSLNRNNTDGTVTNLTDFDNRGEQFGNDNLNNF